MKICRKHHRISFWLTVCWLGAGACDGVLYRAEDPGLDADGGSAVKENGGQNTGMDLADPADFDDAGIGGLPSTGDAHNDGAALPQDTIKPLPDTLACGIQIIGVTANQAVDCDLVVNRRLIPVASRDVPLISGREMLLRINYTVNQGFSARRLEGRLVLTQPDNTTTVYQDQRRVAGPAIMDTLEGTFHWLVAAKDLRHGTRYHVTINELEGEGATACDTSEARFPVAGHAEFEAWKERMILDLMLVPFTCNNGNKPVDLSSQNINDLKNFLYNIYPVQQVNVQVHSALASASCSEFEAAESDLPALRKKENAPVYMYYAGLLNGDGAGYSIPISGSDKKEYRRTFALHTWRDYGLSFDLFAHELGHNHGRDHSFEDNLYPYNNPQLCGVRQRIGYGIRSATIPQSVYSNDRDIGIPWIDPHQQLLPPTTPNPCVGGPDGNRGNWNDIMSYAYPFWISAYTYAALAKHIRLVSSWRPGLTP